MVASITATNAGLSLMLARESGNGYIYWYWTRYCQLVLCVINFVSVKWICLETIGAVFRTVKEWFFGGGNWHTGFV